jgi:gliding motility-associated-like protein
MTLTILFSCIRYSFKIFEPIGNVLLFVIFLILSFPALSQNINRFEYFVDIDPGYGLGTIVNVTPATAINDFDIPISTSSLSAGFHKLYIRAQNVTNQWTHTQLRSFYIVQLATSTDIEQIEYFIDTDPGIGLATQVSFAAAPTITNLAIDISAVLLTPGFHKLYVRSKSSDGQWTHTQQRSFYIANVGVAQNLVKFEYFFDTDPGFDNGISAPVTPPVPSVTNQDIFADVSSLTIGSHTIYVRAKDSGGEWTQVTTGIFSVTAALPPTISSFTPASGPAGTAVTVTGTNFTGATGVTFGGTAATLFTVVSATTITAVVGTGTSGNISVITPAGTATSSSAFTITPAAALPTISNFTPASGPAGTSVTVTGTNFTGATGVTFGGIAATSFTVVSATTITAVVGTGTSGNISVITSGGTAISDSAFTITVPNTITIFPQPTFTAVCDGATASFTVTAAGTTNIVYQWQKFNGTVFTDVANGGGYGGTTSIVLTITTIGAFGAGDYRCKVSGDFAPDVFSNTATLTVNPIPIAPSAAIGASSCGPGSVTVSVSGGTNGQYRWYIAASGGTALTGEVNSSYTTPTISATTTYYVAINNGLCESTRTAATATIVVTATPTVTGISACPGSSLILKASGGLNGQYKWYSDLVSGTPIAGYVNDTFTTPLINSTTTYYVSVTDNGCESSRTPVIASIVTAGCAPVIPSQRFNLPVEGKVEVDLTKLITINGILDISSIRVLTQPQSGALASISNGILTIDYKGKPYVGKESIVIEACSTTGLCSQQTFNIEVAGDIIVYNALSPNGDGLNDFLKLQNIELLPDTKNNQVMIYNRWGDEVFKVDNYDNADRVFKGDSNNGSKLPSGTYFYKIVLNNVGKTMTGFISLKY